MMRAPASAARRMTSALRVSMETGTRALLASASITGRTRRHSSSRLTGSAPGRVEFAADVEDVGAFRLQLQAVGDGGFRREVAAAVGEAVGRDVDDAHDAGPVERQPGDRRTRALQSLQQLEDARRLPARHRPPAPGGGARQPRRAR